MGHLGLELAHPQEIQSQGQGLAEAIQIQLTKGRARPWHQPAKIQPGWIQPGQPMAVQAPPPQAEIAMALLELLPRTQIGPKNPRIAPGGGWAQDRGRAHGRWPCQRCGTDQQHR